MATKKLILLFLSLSCYIGITTSFPLYSYHRQNHHLSSSSSSSLWTQSSSHYTWHDHRIRRRNNGSKTLSMKRAPLPTNTNDSIDDDRIKKPIRAQRPLLGHVVPKTARQKMIQQQQQQSRGGSSAPLLRSQGKKQTNTSSPSNLRIISGTAKNRRLFSPTVHLRPMMGKVRAAVFSTLTSFGLYDAGGGNDAVSAKTRHLDIFAGSGSVGLESLSRGASFCTFVDLSDDCCDTVRKNLEVCGFDADDDDGDDSGSRRGVVVRGDAFQALRHPRSMGIEGYFDLVTICPPYEEIVYADLLDAVANSELLEEDAIVLIEYPVELGCLPHVLERENGGRLVGVRNRKYGRTVIAMYVVNPSGRMEVADSRPEEFVSF